MSIARPLRVLKSSSNPKERGLYCEYRAAQFYLRSGFQLISHQWKTPFAEVDLVFFRNNELRAVEVKSLKSLEYAATRLTWKQKQRLERVFLWLVTGNGSKALGIHPKVEVHFDLVFVSKEDQVYCHKDFLSELP